MIKSKNLFYSVVFLTCILSSCISDKPVEVPNPVVSISGNGVFITNEGNFQFGNAEVSYYDPTQDRVSQDLFKPVNNRPLGDVCQSMCLFNKKAYLVLNNSGKIEVVNPLTFVSIATINGFTSPRYILPISNSKAYVSDLSANSITIVNLSTNSITGSIPCSGWTEGMALAYGKVFVTNQKRDKIYVINILNDVLTDSIQVSYSSNSIKEDKNGKLWVLCSGDAEKGMKAGLHRINPVTNLVEQSFQFSQTTDSPWRLTFNGTGDTLYFLNKGVCRMAINSTELPITPFIEQGGSKFYGLGVDPTTGVIYVADAIDYVQKGVIYRYKPDGILINTFLAGIIPGDFYFN